MGEVGQSLQQKKEQDGASREPVSKEFDIAERLEQWKIEATNPEDPNYVHAELDHPARCYAAITSLLGKLATATESFTEDDVVELFGQLNSGQRMKNQVAQNNALPELRESLLNLVYGKGAPAARIEQTARDIRFAGSAMLG